MELLDGKLVKNHWMEIIKKEVDFFVGKGNRPPKLAAILIGNNPASQSYISSKIKTCLELGIDSLMIEKDSDISENELIESIKSINNDVSIDGLLIQLPLPNHIDENKIIQTISVDKDVDGFHPINIGKLSKNLEAIIPATPYGILKMIEYYNIQTSGKKCVVIGRSNIVGMPMSILMGLNKYPGNCTVTLCHSKTNDLKFHTLQADIIIVAVGIPKMLKADMVKDGVVIIDVGINSVVDPSKKSGHKLVGDVDFEGLMEKASFITPVPGGVGLMTIVALMLNTMKLYKQHLHL